MAPGPEIAVPGGEERKGARVTKPECPTPTAALGLPEVAPDGVVACRHHGRVSDPTCCTFPRPELLLQTQEMQSPLTEMCGD